MPSYVKLSYSKLQLDNHCSGLGLSKLSIGSIHEWEASEGSYPYDCSSSWSGHLYIEDLESEKCAWMSVCASSLRWKTALRYEIVNIHFNRILISVCSSEVSQENICPTELMAHESRFHSFFSLDRWKDGGRDEKMEWTSNCSALANRPFREIPRGNRAFSRLRPTPLATSVCVYVCACSPLGLNNVQSGWYLSPHRKKKKRSRGCVLVCVLTRPSARGSHKSPRSDGGSTAVG